ncbi:MAG: DUF523 domain-containing protein [Lachnospiraceae bacterium]|nr:DUF523 domain-containing protein [Lachnospiraceae bacterium]
MNILVSACLLGLNCKYDGGNNLREELKELVDKHNLVPFCPEVYGGLTTPRVPSERLGDKVVNKEGIDVTENFVRGAEEALRMAQAFDCKYAIFKAKSPSCGCGRIYDGTFTGTLTDGDGVTTELLKKHGISVLTEKELSKIKRLS